MPGFLKQFSHSEPVIAAITASELLHGVERAQDAVRKTRRQRHVRSSKQRWDESHTHDAA